MAKKEQEEELVKGCLRNDRKYQKQMFETYFSGMMVICLRYARDRDEAEDILQKGFIKVFAKLDMYIGGGSLEGWIKRIMVRTAIDHFRLTQRENRNLNYDLEDWDSPEDATIESELAAEEILKLVQKLPAVQRAVFNLFALEGFSHREIAEELQITEGTSKWHLCEARKTLKKMLSPVPEKRVKEYAA